MGGEARQFHLVNNLQERLAAGLTHNHMLPVYDSGSSPRHLLFFSVV